MRTRQPPRAKTPSKKALLAVMAAALQVTTDAAQDWLEDPGGADRAMPYRRIHDAAIQGLNAALAVARKETRS